MRINTDVTDITLIWFPCTKGGGYNNFYNYYQTICYKNKLELGYKIIFSCLEQKNLLKSSFKYLFSDQDC